MKYLKTAFVFIFGIAVGALLLNPNWTQKSHAGSNLPVDLFYLVQSQPAKQYYKLNEKYANKYIAKSAGITNGGGYFYVYVDPK